MKNDNCSDTAFKAAREITRPIHDDPWCPNWEPGDDERQHHADEMFGTAVALSRELLRDPDAETGLNEENKY
jgi:hypothetical protein